MKQAKASTCFTVAFICFFNIILFYFITFKSVSVLLCGRGAAGDLDWLSPLHSSKKSRWSLPQVIELEMQSLDLESRDRNFMTQKQTKSQNIQDDPATCWDVFSSPTDLCSLSCLDVLGFLSFFATCIASS